MKLCYGYQWAVHKGAHHIPKAVSDHGLLPDWVRDLNYVRSQALQPPSWSQTGFVYCQVIFCSYCADWPMHGFSAHFQTAHARITFRKSFAFTTVKIMLSNQITIQNGFWSVIRSFMNRPFDVTLTVQNGQDLYSCVEMTSLLDAQCGGFLCVAYSLPYIYQIVLIFVWSLLVKFDIWHVGAICTDVPCVCVCVWGGGGRGDHSILLFLYMR